MLFASFCIGQISRQLHRVYENTISVLYLEKMLSNCLTIHACSSQKLTLISQENIFYGKFFSGPIPVTTVFQIFQLFMLNSLDIYKIIQVEEVVCLELVNPLTLRAAKTGLTILEICF